MADILFGILPKLLAYHYQENISFKSQLKVRKISARMIPHLLTDEQKRVRVQMAKQLLKQISKIQPKAISKHCFW